MVTVCCHVSCRCRHVTLVAGLYLAAEDMLWHVVARCPVCFAGHGPTAATASLRMWLQRVLRVVG